MMPLAIEDDGHPMPTRIVAVRHGETAWNVDTRIQGQLDIELNALGRWQAARVAEALGSEGIDAIYSSDLRRAHQTALAIGTVCGLPVRLEAGLRERAFGSFVGKTWAEIETLWPDQSRRWRARDLGFRPHGGESLPEFYRRVVAACSEIAASHAGQCIAIIAHGGVMDVLRRAATRMDLAAPRTWLLGNATINRLLHSSEGFALVGWGDADHLRGPIAQEVADDGTGWVTAPGSTEDDVGHAA